MSQPRSLLDQSRYSVNSSVEQNDIAKLENVPPTARKYLRDTWASDKLYCNESFESIERALASEKEKETVNKSSVSR
jgi:hypothetical protein